jgi:hypothetical protein
LLLEQSVRAHCICQVQEPGVEVGAIKFQRLFVERLRFGEVRLLKKHVGDVPDGVRVGERIWFAAVKGRGFGVKAAGFVEAMFRAGFASFFNECGGGGQCGLLSLALR